MWYLIDSEDDSSLCIVHEKNLLLAGQEISCGMKVVFFYQGKRYNGTILPKDADHDRLNTELDKRVKAIGKKVRPQVASSKTMVNDSKRRITPVNLFVSTETEKPTKNAPKLSEVDKSRQRILNLNKKEAEKRSNASLVAKSQRRDPDPDFDPLDETSMDSVIDPDSHRSTLRNDKYRVMKDLAEGSRSTVPSPSKEELKKQHEQLREELELLRKKVQQEPTLEGTTFAAKRKSDESNNSEPKRKANDVGQDNLNINVQSDIFEAEVEGTVSPASGSKDVNVSGEIPNVDDCNSSLEFQLYGKGEDRTDIGGGTYCRTTILAQALSASHSVNHLIRRLMVGVFKPSMIMNCTVTGQSWHSGGQERAQVEMTPLHPGALQAITDFSNSVSKTKKWKTIKKEKCNQVFAVKLVEIKKQVKEGKLKD